jgi:hypothetical protein
MITREQASECIAKGSKVYLCIEDYPCTKIKSFMNTDDHSVYVFVYGMCDLSELFLTIEEAILARCKPMEVIDENR